uniref:Uncharacterized protein n=1 Tax=Tanacetum cinerariifolium TaxID=118510 RepID=A0A6L2MGY6_TANCI|nr:hypothetical protein [Tanacetum cinerariifolium]
MESDDTEVVDFSIASPQKDDDEITLAKILTNIKKSATKDKARIAQENLAQVEQWDDVKAHIQADEDLAQRMLEEERESLSIEKSEGQIPDSKAGEGSSKEGKSLKILAKEELGQEQQKKQKSLVKERFNSSNPTKDKEITLWIELKRLFEPDGDDAL